MTSGRPRAKPAAGSGAAGRPSALRTSNPSPLPAAVVQDERDAALAAQAVDGLRAAVRRQRRDRAPSARPRAAPPCASTDWRRRPSPPRPSTPSPRAASRRAPPRRRAGRATTRGIVAERERRVGLRVAVGASTGLRGLRTAGTAIPRRPAPMRRRAAGPPAPARRRGGSRPARPRRPPCARRAAPPRAPRARSSPAGTRPDRRRRCCRGRDPGRSSAVGVTFSAGSSNVLVSSSRTRSKISSRVIESPPHGPSPRR